MRLEESPYNALGASFVAMPELGTSKKGVAILFGWLDGKFQYVEKYGKYYRSSGYKTVIILCSSKTQSVLSMSKTDNLDVSEFDPLIQDLALEKMIETSVSSTSVPLSTTTSPLVIHAFSNGGLFRLRQFLKILNAQHKSLINASVILDSCPGKASPTSGVGFLTSGIKNPIAKRIAAAVVYTGLSIYFSAFADPKQHPIHLSAMYAVSEKNLDGNLVGPRLFLYSDRDELVPFKEVEDWILFAKVEGLQVAKVKFSGSSHVKHAVMYPQEYWNVVGEFLGKQHLSNL
ncbi:hypothetical protein BDR26DRAFT_848889 [Obelidium mucronatum]|nr:hypothetical protein BDR26DRAFT_848889 [Obelidium mucronatum]